MTRKNVILEQQAIFGFVIKIFTILTAFCTELQSTHACHTSIFGQSFQQLPTITIKSQKVSHTNFHVKEIMTVNYNPARFSLD